MAIKKDTLHPEGEAGVDIYPKTSIDQVENLQANLDALNGDIANANGEISAVSNRVNANERNITDLQQDVDKNIMDIATAESNIQGLQGSVSTIAEKVDTAKTGLVQLTEQVERVGNQTNENTRDISSLYTAYNSYSDYSVVTNGFLLSYVSGRQIELPIKAGTNVTFSKYPGSNQIVINATGRSVPDNIAILNANNKWTGDNIFDGFSKSIRVNGLFQVSGDEEPISAIYNQVSYDGFNIAYMDGENQNIFHVGIDFENKARFGFDKYNGSSYNLYIPEKDGTIALLSDIPISLMYSSSRLGENSVDFPFNIDKNYFFTITMINTGESKSFIYARGTSSTYTIVINSSTSFEVKLDATGSSTRLIFTNKSNADPFVVRAEISN